MSKRQRIKTTESIQRVKKATYHTLEGLHPPTGTINTERAYRNRKAKDEWIDTTLRRYGISESCKKLSNIMIKIFRPEVIIIGGFTNQLYTITIRNYPVSFFKEPTTSNWVGRKLTRREAKAYKKDIRTILKQQ